MVSLRDGREPMLHGRSVYLRPAERDDLPLFVRWLTDARSTRFLALRSPIGQALEERWFEAVVQQQGTDRWHFVICRIKDDRPVGAIDLHDVDPVNGGAGLGIVIGDPADTGQGYGSDGMVALLDFAFGELRLERVWLDVYDFNERARHVYERLGFVHEAVLRHGLYTAGRHVDVHRMAVLREDWSSRAE